MCLKFSKPLELCRWGQSLYISSWAVVIVCAPAPQQPRARSAAGLCAQLSPVDRLWENKGFQFVTFCEECNGYGEEEGRPGYTAACTPTPPRRRSPQRAARRPGGRPPAPAGAPAGTPNRAGTSWGWATRHETVTKYVQAHTRQIFTFNPSVPWKKEMSKRQAKPKKCWNRFEVQPSEVGPDFLELYLDRVG